jgi:hypothetical protein
VAGIGLQPLSPVQLLSAMLAALASLGLGLVLGPEAPLTALGLTAGLVATRARYATAGSSPGISCPISSSSSRAARAASAFGAV